MPPFVPYKTTFPVMTPSTILETVELAAPAEIAKAF
jgi:hypothetical protein